MKTTLARIALFALFLIPQLSFGDDVYTYQVSGVLKRLPGTGGARNEVLIRHEAIPDYRDSSGKVVGMDAMTMPFYVSDPTILQGLKPGDPIEFTLRSTIGARFVEEITDLHKASPGNQVMETPVPK